jgi:hypothetical protein
MRRFSKLGIIIGLVMLILAGCIKQVTGDEKTAEAYVTRQGYKISSYKGQVDKYILDKGKIFGTMESIPARQAWGVQKIEPDPYIGKEIVVYSFTVSNHPLEKLYNSKTNLSIMLCEGKVIGGTSFPDDNGKMRLLGAPFSVDGKTQEEVTGMKRPVVTSCYYFVF